MNGDGMTEAQSERLVAAFERIAAALERTYPVMPAFTYIPTPANPNPWTPWPTDPPPYAPTSPCQPCQPFGGTVCSLPVGTATNHHAREGEIR